MREREKSERKAEIDKLPWHTPINDCHLCRTYNRDTAIWNIYNMYVYI